MNDLRYEIEEKLSKFNQNILNFSHHNFDIKCLNMEYKNNVNFKH